MLNTIVIVLDVISALFLIVTILLHSGRGSGLSDMFGGGGGLERRDGHGAHARPHHGRDGGPVRPLHVLARLALEPLIGAALGPLLESFFVPRRSGGTW